jgi:hypothetical protein
VSLRPAETRPDLMARSSFFLADQKKAEIIFIAVGRKIEIARNADELFLFNRLFVLLQN